ncbi:4-alpha-glucanotransferase [Actinomyces minihominis]|uniref:4-alpha-glucanotransferase n=1 Tax=Actinomyces minihominis TaxID=2002838 RepID=UPI000C084C02|nr:4-alpha-glucanotransferase [Actinomyces minihominis]
MYVNGDLDHELVKRLADLNGVATFFWTWAGEQQQVETLSLLRVLKALGVAVSPESTNEDVRAAILATEDAPWLDTLPACTVVRQGNWGEIPIHVRHGDPVHVWYRLEDGTTGDLRQLDRLVAPREVNGEWRGRATFEVPGTFPLGYHTVFAEVHGREAVSAPLIVVPKRIDPSVLRGNRRFWGVNAQAYSVQSRSSWGVGDAADLADLLAITAKEGAEFLLVNPMHAAEPVAPIENSPYLPVTRQWLNVSYIRPELVPEYAILPDGERDEIEELRGISMVEDDDILLDRDRTWAAKEKALRMIYRAPRSVHREAQFQNFCLEGKEGLEKYALWCALVESTGSIDLPDEYASPDKPAVTEFAAQHRAEISFFKWLQWVALEQLSSSNRIAKDLGMPIGVMADLAVGIHPAGSDVWADRGDFAPGMYVGAPPDMYSQQGQSWSQPPYNPRRMAELGYEPLRKVIATTLKLAGALRIDHILGLFRLWWLPEGGSPADGTYVYYDHEAMIGVLLLEAHRADAVIIGEDLGTVEPWVREYLGTRGIFGTSVLWFEKEGSGWPLHAEHYRRDILGTVNTHDLPPTQGYIEGIQTTLRNELGLLVEDVAKVREQDTQEQEQMAVRLREYGFIEEDADDAAFMDGLHRYICRTPARLVAAALVDAVGEKRPQNLPGTNDEYPNWCVPLADGDGNRVWLDDLAQKKGNRLFKVMRDSLGQ